LRTRRARDNLGTLRLARSSTASFVVPCRRCRRSGETAAGLSERGIDFQNPAGEFAGRLIEQARVEGAAVNAQVSATANFIVNLGGVSADVRDLMSRAGR
jgi:UDP-N-acetylenolpyruvoylglucosamine reductase